jgi:hypothetical protein
MEKSKQFYNDILELEVNYKAPPEFGWMEFKLPVKEAFLGLGKTMKNNKDLLLQ